MPSCTSLIRLLRRRLVLGLIFALSLTYCAFSLLRNEKRGPHLDNDLDMDPMMINDNNDMIPDDNTLEELRASDKPPLWQMEILDQAASDNAGNIEANLNDSDASTQSCRNSIQGRGLIVDDRGVVCSRHEVLSNGCCAIEPRKAPKNEGSLSMARRERYSCKTCNPQGCCTIYEYCVSCCLHPDKQIRGRKDVLTGSAKVQKNVGRTPVRNSDRFQICLAACRTSSSSVRHENTYKDPLAKHCYTPQRYRRNINSLNNNGDNPAVVVTSFSVVTLLTYPSSGSYSYLTNPIILSSILY
ncbi:PREDICTED: UPF0454 protein C12orf49 homolog isoform X1 [Wasmannia auropunctata]|uniref:UPF0454 protein C12orf49 homolog isoform X1 n=2 Tax=Wasmannia auropunctata TaxID=64793 RepID=UPI0005F08AAE|nr:PREDICTED: UPF0454 protein C12orf49 homolog isoform X1 [Wasmannia auropunctata]XP_011687873.1 PREDICTED: UPF0454 protein C12orf49 homolog isoform X1 [Wasmannia auropunctata]